MTRPRGPRLPRDGPRLPRRARSRPPPAPRKRSNVSSASSTEPRPARTAAAVPAGGSLRAAHPAWYSRCMDGTRKMGESLAKPAAAGAAHVDGGALVGQVLAEQRVRHLFTINGGHILPILSHLLEHGIQMVHMRHEQSCAYAADAYARTSGRPGVLSVTAGCGLTNAVTGLCVAGLTGSPVVCLAGQHPTTEDQLGSFQEAYGVDICRTFSKFTKRVLAWSTIAADVRLAFREAMSPPPGPTLVEIPTNILYHHDEPAKQRRGARRFKFWGAEHFGQPPTWNAEATYIQVDAAPERVGWHVPAEIPIVGDPKLVLRQLCDLAAARRIARQGGAWLAEVAGVRAQFDQALRAQEAEVHERTPIHPARVTRDLLELMDRDATLVIDSFTLSGWLSQWFGARFAGQIVDAGPLAPVGHGIGMGIGVQLARPGKRVLVVIGDDGFGLGGTRLATAS